MRRVGRRSGIWPRSSLVLSRKDTDNVSTCSHHIFSCIRKITLHLTVNTLKVFICAKFALLTNRKMVSFRVSCDKKHERIVLRVADCKAQGTDISHTLNEICLSTEHGIRNRN